MDLLLCYYAVLYNALFEGSEGPRAPAIKLKLLLDTWEPRTICQHPRSTSSPWKRNSKNPWLRRTRPPKHRTPPRPRFFCPWQGAGKAWQGAGKAWQGPGTRVKDRGKGRQTVPRSLGVSERTTPAPASRGSTLRSESTLDSLEVLLSKWDS